MHIALFEKNGYPKLVVVKHCAGASEVGASPQGPPEFATSSHNNIKLFLYFSRFSLIFLCPYDIMYM